MRGGWDRSFSMSAWPIRAAGRPTPSGRPASPCCLPRSQRSPCRAGPSTEECVAGICGNRRVVFLRLIGVELTLVMLAAPAATAVAICVDRARGSLAYMLATDLSDAEIVLGKLSSRLLPVLGLVACSWPVLALSSLFGGIDPQAVALAFAIILAVALLGCSMAMRCRCGPVSRTRSYWSSTLSGRSCCSSGRSGTCWPGRGSSVRRPPGATRSVEQIPVGRRADDPRHVQDIPDRPEEQHDAPRRCRRPARPRAACWPRWKPSGRSCNQAGRGRR